jgi:hypothetical protein
MHQKIVNPIFGSCIYWVLPVLQEPLAHLVFAVTQVLVRVRGEEADSKPWFPQIEREVSDIALKYSQCSLHDLGFVSIKSLSSGAKEQSLGVKWTKSPHNDIKHWT